MSRPVYIADTALLCARGQSPSAVAAALWRGDSAAGEFALGERRFPYYPLPLPNGNWLARAEAATQSITVSVVHRALRPGDLGGQCAAALP